MGGVGQDLRIGAQHIQDRFAEQIQHHGQECAGQQGTPAAKTGDAAGILAVTGTQRIGHHGTATHAQHSGTGRGQGKDRSHHRYRCGLSSVLQQSDEKQIGHIIDDHDQNR